MISHFNTNPAIFIANHAHIHYYYISTQKEHYLWNNMKKKDI